MTYYDYNHNLVYNISLRLQNSYLDRPSEIGIQRGPRFSYGKM